MAERRRHLSRTEARAEIRYQVDRQLYFLGEAAVLQISALTGRGV